MERWRQQNFRRTYWGSNHKYLLLYLLIGSFNSFAQTNVKPGFNLFSPEQDIEIGRQSAAEVERQITATISKSSVPPTQQIDESIREVAYEIANRLTRMFLRDKSGRRLVYGGTEKFQTDPQRKDYILFYEYFHGDNGAGPGASHQTGWTGVVAKLIELFGRIDAQQLLDAGKAGGFAKGGSKA